MDKMDRESSLQKLECLLAPKTKQSYLFLAPLQWPWQGCCWYKLRECNAVRRSCVPPPPYRHYRHCPPPPPPRPFASVRFDPLAWSSGSDQRRISGCGIRWLLAGPDSLPLWLCRVCAFVLLRCFSCSHTVLPKEHSLGIIFFSYLSSCKCCIFLQFYLHFTIDYTCMIVYVTNNKEPWTLNEACKYELERQYKCGARDNYVRIWYWTPLGWTSSDHGDHRDVSFPLSGNRGYDSNRSVPFRAFTRHHGEFLRYGNAIQSRRERGYRQPVPVTQRGRIPINNGARRAGSQLIGGDKPMSA